MNWAVEIQKFSISKRNLNDLLLNLGFNLIEYDQYLAFTSPEIDDCEDPERVFEIAKKVRSAFKSSSQIDLDFTLGAVLNFSSNTVKKQYFLEVESCIQKNTCSSASLIISPPDDLSDEELDAWNARKTEQEYQAQLEKLLSKIVPPFYSSRAEKILKLLNDDNPSGEILYKIYELAQGPASNRNKFQADFNISKVQFERFCDAVHSPEVSGDWARHGFGHRPKSPNPMTKDEARIFIQNIANKWLETVQINKSDSF